jgi:hypothetical protein
MTMPTRNRRSSYLTTLAIAAIGLAAVTIPLAPAKAQIGVQVGHLVLVSRLHRRLMYIIRIPRRTPTPITGRGITRGTITDTDTLTRVG